MIQAISAAENLELHWMYARTAFFNGYLSEEIFMDHYESFIDIEYHDHVGSY